MANFDRIVVSWGGLGQNHYQGSKITWAGEAEVGGKRLCLNGYFSDGVLTHELGHTYGLLHANMWQSSACDVIGDGRSMPYGDPFDMMGGGINAEGHFNPWFKLQLNWIETNQVLAVHSNGQYRINAFDSIEASGTLALKIPRDDSRDCWVALRQKWTNSATVHGAYVFWGYQQNRSSDLLDMTPGSNPGGDQLDAGLVIGRTFLDPVAGIYIAPLRKGGTTSQAFWDVLVKTDAFAPRIIAQPVSQTVAEGTNVILQVAAQSSVPLGYQWWCNVNAVEGATNAFLNLAAMQQDRAGCYHVVLSNCYGTVTSTVACVTVTTPLGLAADNLVVRWSSSPNAPWIFQTTVTHDGNDAVQSGVAPLGEASVIETVVEGPGGLSFWWKISSQTNFNFLQFSCGAETQRISGEIDWTQVILSIPSGVQRLEWAYFKNTANGKTSDCGWLDEVSFVNEPRIIQGPSHQQVPEHALVGFSVVATSTGPLRYQWQFGSNNIARATNATLSVKDVHSTNAGFYRVIVSSGFGSVTSTPAALKITLTPQYEWVRQLGGDRDESGKGLAVDGQGNFYVCGTFYNNIKLGETVYTNYQNSDIFICKVDPTGQFLWTQRIEGPYSDDMGGVAVDSAGNCYVAGSFWGEANFGTTNLSGGFTEVFLAKYDPDGKLLWVRQAGGSMYDWAYSLIMDADCNLYIGGTADRATFSSEFRYVSGAFVAKYTREGDLVWVRSGSYGDGRDVAVDRFGNVYLLGDFYGGIYFGSTLLIARGSTDVFLAKFDDIGNFQWIRHIGDTNTDYAAGVAVDSMGNPCVLAYFAFVTKLESTNFLSYGDNDILLASYDPEGNLRWAQHAGGFTGTVVSISSPMPMARFTSKRMSSRTARLVLLCLPVMAEPVS